MKTNPKFPNKVDLHYWQHRQTPSWARTRLEWSLPNNGDIHHVINSHTAYPDTRDKHHYLHNVMVSVKAVVRTAQRQGKPPGPYVRKCLDQFVLSNHVRTARTVVKWINRLDTNPAYAH